MMELLAKTCNFHDPECVQTLREGARLLGILPLTGNGSPNVVEASMTEEDLVKGRLLQNAQILKRLRQDKNAGELQRLASEDAALGRMSAPRRWRPLDSVEATLCPRFGVEQGACTSRPAVHCSRVLRADGSQDENPGCKGFPIRLAGARCGHYPGGCGEVVRTASRGDLGVQTMLARRRRLRDT